MPLSLITGPVRSGKSTFAQRLAMESGLPVRYIATARRDTHDPEWETRLARHAHDRPRDWTIIETAQLSVADQLLLFAEAAPKECLIVDSLGTWIASQLNEHTEPEALEATALAFSGALLQCRATIVAVGEQVGWDVVPTAASARLFRDILGRMQQRLALEGARTVLVVAGFAIDLRAIGSPIGSLSTESKGLRLDT